MVNFANGVLYALLATAASAELRHDRRHHHHRRKAPCTTETLGGPSGAPYPVSNSTASAGPTGSSSDALTTTISATSTIVSTVTVVPIPVSTDAGAGPSGTAPGGSSPSGVSPGGPGGAPGSGSSSAAPGSGETGGSGQCAPPQTVTVTAQNTVTVTAGAAGTSSSSFSSSLAAPSSESSAAAAPGSAAPSSSDVAPAPASPEPEPVQASPTPSSSAAAVPADQTPSPGPNKVGSSPTPSDSSAPSPPSGPPAGGKCGISYTGSNQTTPFSGSISWAFNWNPSPADLPKNIEFVPSLQKPEWTASLVASLPSATGAKYIKSLNEPDMSVVNGGTAQTPKQAADIHTGTLNSLAGQGYSIGTPGITSYNTSSGLAGFASGITWLQQFHDECAGQCNIGWIDLHWYADGNNGESGNAEKQAEHFMSYIKQATSDVVALYGSGVEIWITEFSAYPKADQDPQINVDFLNIVIPQLESSSIVRYAYYMAEFLENGSSLNSVGSALIAAAGGS